MALKSAIRNLQSAILFSQGATATTTADRPQPDKIIPLATFPHE